MYPFNLLRAVPSQHYKNLSAACHIRAFILIIIVTVSHMLSFLFLLFSCFLTIAQGVVTGANLLSSAVQDNLARVIKRVHFTETFSQRRLFFQPDLPCCKGRS